MNSTLKNPFHIDIYKKNIPNILESFLELAGKEQIPKNGLPRDHPFKQTIDYYLENTDIDWSQKDIPEFIKETINEIAHIVYLKVIILKATGGKPLKALLKSELIPTLCFEALIGSNYIRRGYVITWLSPFEKDPPDLVVFDPNINKTIDIECEIKDSKIIDKNYDEAIESMFDSLSKGLQSLKNRKEPFSEMAAIAIHSPIDLRWSEWLTSEEVKKRLTSRLKNPEYNIVSGIMFSGGSIVEAKPGIKEYSTGLVSYRFFAAKAHLPVGFLPSESGTL